MKNNYAQMRKLGSVGCSQKVDKSDSMPEGTFFNEPAGGRFPGGREVVIELELLSKRGWLVF